MASNFGEHSQQPCRRRGCFRSEEGRRRSNSTFVFVLAFSACVEGDTKAKTETFLEVAFSACVEGDTKAKTETFLEVWNVGREYECKKCLHCKKRQVKKCSKKHDPHARKKRTRTADASQQHKRVAASNVVC